MKQTRAITLGIAAILGVWALIWFGCLRGTVGPNQYGPDPLEGRVGDHASADVSAALTGARPCPIGGA